MKNFYLKKTFSHLISNKKRYEENNENLADIIIIFFDGGLILKISVLYFQLDNKFLTLH